MIKHKMFFPEKINDESPKRCLVGDARPDCVDYSTNAECRQGSPGRFILTLSASHLMERFDDVETLWLKADILKSTLKHIIALAVAVGECASESLSHHANEATQAGTRPEDREASTVVVRIAGIPSPLSEVKARACMAQGEAQESLSSKGDPVNGTHD